MQTDPIHTLLADLQKIQVLKTGEFKLKSGLISPVYIDLRHLSCHPHILQKVSEALYQKIKNLKFDYLCGVPYAATPVATCISIMHNIPAVLRRKEPKAHGTGRVIEGDYQPNQSCVIIEDVITQGTSIMETIHDIEAAGLKITAIAAIVDREQGGTDKLKAQGYHTLSLLTLQEIINAVT